MARLLSFSLGFLAVGCAGEKEGVVANPPAGELTLISPAPASWAAIGSVEVSGEARHVTGVTVNAAEARMNGGEFFADLVLGRGVNVVEASGIDERGDTLFARHGVLAGDFHTPDDAVEDALLVRVNQGALDTALEAAGAALSSDMLRDSLSAVNPVYSDSYGVWGWDAVTIAADVTDVSFKTPALSVVPTAGRLLFTASLPDLFVEINAYGDVVGFDFDTLVTLEASEAVITGTLDVSAEDGRLVVSLDDATVELRDFAYDTSLLPGDIEAYILVETIRDTLEAQIVAQIEAQVPPLLDATLSGLDPSFSTELLGVAVSLEFSFARVDVDADGLLLALDLDVSIPQDTTHTYVGYLGAGSGTPELDTDTDLAAAISDDLLNRMLFEAWRGGLLDLRLSTDDGTLEPFLLTSFEADEGTITVSAGLPPVVVERDGALEAQLAELIVTVDTPGGALGEHLEVAIAAFVGLELSIRDGALTLGLGAPTLTMVVRDSDWGASNETVTRLIEDMLPLDALLALLGDLSIPIPMLYGIGIDSGDVTRDADGVHTGVEIWLQ